MRNRQHDDTKLVPGAAPAAPLADLSAPGFIEARTGERLWRLARPGDLESLWAAMGQDDFGPDERLPYWVELWPAAVLLARHISDNAGQLAGRTCVDAGCGLGLASLAAAEAGASVVGFDYEAEALTYARMNAALNLGPAAKAPLFTVMDWRKPAVAKGGADFVLGADILYERRFFEPVVAFLEHALKKGGRAWIADPERTVSAGADGRLIARGWRVCVLRRERVAQGGQNMTVRLLEISRS